MKNKNVLSEMFGMIRKRKSYWLVPVIVMTLLVMPFVYASLGTFKAETCIQIVTNLNTSATNISGIATPLSTIYAVNQPMTKNGSYFNYTFCHTNETGIYTYGYCDFVGNCYSNSFEITTTGKGDGTVIPIFLYIGGFLLFAMALWKKQEIIGLFSGFIFIVAAVYILIYGFSAIVSDYTRMLAYVTLGLGFIISFISMIEIFYEGALKEEED